MKNLGFLMLSAVLTLGADRCAKRWAVRRERQGRRLAFGTISLHPVPGRACTDQRADAALWLVEALFAVVVTAWLAHDALLPAALGLALGGAASNLVDRRRLGAVVDHLHLGFGRVFNLADVGIVVGSLAGTFGIVRAALATPA